MVELLLFYMITRQFSSQKKSVPQKEAHIDRIPANMSHFSNLHHRRNAQGRLRLQPTVASQLNEFLQLGFQGYYTLGGGVGGNAPYKGSFLILPALRGYFFGVGATFSINTSL